MVKKVATAVLVAILALVTAGCGEDKIPQVDSGSADAPTAVGGTESAEANGPSEDDLQTLFDALGSAQVSDLKVAVPLTAPGSLAELYVKHQLNGAQASLDSGASYEADTVVEKDGAYVSCAAGDSSDDCTTWADIQAQGDKVASFTTNGKQLDDRLLAGSKKVFRAGSMAKVRILTAYETITGNLSITLDIQNVASEGIAVESRTSYRSEEGRQSDVGSTGPTVLQPDSRATYEISVTSGALGGDLHLEIYTERGGANGVVDIPIR